MGREGLIGWGDDWMTDEACYDSGMMRADHRGVLRSLKDERILVAVFVA